MNKYFIDGIYGAILAQQSGRDIDIINSFELPFDITTKTIDETYLTTKLEQRNTWIKRRE